MNGTRPLISAVVASVTVLLAGCSVSSTPPVPLRAAPTVALAWATTNTTYTADLSASGGVPPYSWSVASGSVPPGLVLGNAGTLSGTPSSAGSFSFTAQVTDLAHPKEAANVVVSVTIVDPLQVTTTSLPNSSVGVSYSAALAAAGGFPAYTWSIAQGSLPSGLTLNAATGVISGTPAAAGTSNVSVSVSDSQRPSNTANASLSVTIAPALQITTTSLPNSSAGLYYSATLVATGGFPGYTWSITQGSLPSGLTLNATSGLISGTPMGAGTRSFTVHASDNGTMSASASASLSIAIQSPPARNAVLFVGQWTGTIYGPWNLNGLQIQADGSLTPLPTAPQAVSNPAGTYLSFPVPSPNLPLLLLNDSKTGLESLLVNPDYSLVPYTNSQSSQPPVAAFGISVDPTGSNLYVRTDFNCGDLGITIFPGDGSFQPLQTLCKHNDELSISTFTPDGHYGFGAACDSPLADFPECFFGEYSRASNGTLSSVSGFIVSGGSFRSAVSPDGKYLAVGTNQPNWSTLSPPGTRIDIFGIGSNGDLSGLTTQSFTVSLGPGATDTATVNDMVWDQSSSYLIVSTSGRLNSANGGVAVLSFSGSDLTQIADPIGAGTGRIQRTGSSVYAIGQCDTNLVCQGILGFNFQNGTLSPLPGSPYPYANVFEMFIY